MRIINLLLIRKHVCQPRRPAYSRVVFLPAILTVATFYDFLCALSCLGLNFIIFKKIAREHREELKFKSLFNFNKTSVNSVVQLLLPHDLLFPPLLIELAFIAVVVFLRKGPLDLPSQKVPATAQQILPKLGYAGHLVAQSLSLPHFMYSQHFTSRDSSSLWNGKYRVKDVPLPSSLSTFTNPPCSSIIFLVMERPRPVPWPIFFVLKNGSKIRGIFVGGYPSLCQ